MLRLRLKIGRSRHQQILLDPVRGDGEAVTGEIEERDLGAFAGLGKVGHRLFEAVEIEVGLHGDREADAFETVGDEAGVDGGVRERGVRIGAVGDDERDEAAGSRPLRPIGAEELAPAALTASATFHSLAEPSSLADANARPSAEEAAQCAARSSAGVRNACAAAGPDSPSASAISSRSRARRGGGPALRRATLRPKI